jgi:site-specific DNA recombinase
MNNIKGLRFAPLIRVSSEAQERKGESLKVQKDEIEKAVNMAGGTIPEYCWSYSGQESATSDQERRKLDALLNDSSKDLFDAVIVYDPSRWSRDNLKSEEGLRILKKNGIKFFTGPVEIDLFDPNQEYYLATSVASAQLHAKQQALKSILSKKARLKQNIPAVGKMPYGRTFNKRTKEWGIDKDKQKKVQEAAKMFIENVPVSTISKRTGIEIVHLYKLFRNSCGDEWVVDFKPKLFPNLAEKITVKIPPLLPEKTIKAIHKKIEYNRTLHHGKIRHEYLLSRMIFCEECGYSLSGTTIRKKGRKDLRYYKHFKMSGKKEINCKSFSHIRAELIEDAVMRDIFESFGDVKKREEMMKKASTDWKEAKGLENDIKRFNKELANINRRKKRLINAVEDGTFESSDIKERMKELKEKEGLIKVDIQVAKAKLDQFISEEEIKKAAKGVTAQKDYVGPSEEAAEKMIDWVYFGTEARLEEMTFEQKKELLQLLFMGKSIDGQRYGVYVKKGKKGKWHYRVRGSFGNLTGTIKNGDSGPNNPDGPSGGTSGNPKKSGSSTFEVNKHCQDKKIAVKVLLERVISFIHRKPCH